MCSSLCRELDDALHHASQFNSLHKNSEVISMVENITEVLGYLVSFMTDLLELSFGGFTLRIFFAGALVFFFVYSFMRR